MNIYHFFPHFIRVSIRYNQNEFKYENIKSTIAFEGLTKIQESIVKLLLDKPTLTQPELARILGVGERKIRYNMKELIDNNFIERIGSNKTGEWMVFSHNYFRRRKFIANCISKYFQKINYKHWYIK